MFSKLGYTLLFKHYLHLVFKYRYLILGRLCKLTDHSTYWGDSYTQCNINEERKIIEKWFENSRQKVAELHIQVKIQEKSCVYRYTQNPPTNLQEYKSNFN